MRLITLNLLFVRFLHQPPLLLTIHYIDTPCTVTVLFSLSQNHHVMCTCLFNEELGWHCPLLPHDNKSGKDSSSQSRWGLQTKPTLQFKSPSSRFSARFVSIKRLRSALPSLKLSTPSSSTSTISRSGKSLRTYSSVFDGTSVFGQWKKPHFKHVRSVLGESIGGGL